MKPISSADDVVVYTVTKQNDHNVFNAQATNRIKSTALVVDTFYDYI